MTKAGMTLNSCTGWPPTGLASESLLPPGFDFWTMTRTSFVGSTCAPYCNSGCTLSEVSMLGVAVWAPALGLSAEPRTTQASTRASTRQTFVFRMSWGLQEAWTPACARSGWAHFGNPAVVSWVNDRGRPVALRRRLSAGLPVRFDPLEFRPARALRPPLSGGSRPPNSGDVRVFRQ